MFPEHFQDDTLNDDSDNTVATGATTITTSTSDTSTVVGSSTKSSYNTPFTTPAAGNVIKTSRKNHKSTVGGSRTTVGGLKVINQYKKQGDLNSRMLRNSIHATAPLLLHVDEELVKVQDLVKGLPRGDLNSFCKLLMASISEVVKVLIPYGGEEDISKDLGVHLQHLRNSYVDLVGTDDDLLYDSDNENTTLSDLLRRRKILVTGKKRAAVLEAEDESPHKAGRGLVLEGDDEGPDVVEE